MRWEAGELQLLDHQDAAAEEALAALGGRPPACLVVRSLWRSHAATVELVTLGRRPAEEHLGLGDLAGALDRRPHQVPAAMASSGLASARRLRREAVLERTGDLQVLLSLPGPFIDRLVLHVLVHCTANWGDEAFRDRHGLRLGAALRARAAPVLTRLGARLSADGDVHVECAPCPPGSDLSLSARAREGAVRVDAWLPISWLSSVWARGASEAEGRFVVAAAPRADAVLDATYVEWEDAGDGSWSASPRRGLLRAGNDGRWRWDPGQTSATRP